MIYQLNQFKKQNIIPTQVQEIQFQCECNIVLYFWGQKGQINTF